MLALVLAPFGHSEIIDRVAVTIDYAVVTESEVRRQIRLAALQNDTEPDFSLASRRAAADRLVEQALIRREIEVTRYTSTQPEKVRPMAETLVKQRFPKAGDLEKAAARYGLTAGEVRDQMLWQVTLLQFVEERFRPAVQVRETEIRQYYEEEFAPQWTKSNSAAPPPLDDAHEEIERILTQQRIDQSLDRWFGEARTQARVRYHEEAFR